jgi:hypothetical protein
VHHRDVRCPWLSSGTNKLRIAVDEPVCIAIAEKSLWERSEIGVHNARDRHSLKISKSVLNPVQGLDEWDKKNLVICRASHKLGVVDDDGA